MDWFRSQEAPDRTPKVFTTSLEAINPVYLRVTRVLVIVPIFAFFLISIYIRFYPIVQ